MPFLQQFQRAGGRCEPVRKGYGSLIPEQGPPKAGFCWIRDSGCPR